MSFRKINFAGGGSVTPFTSFATVPTAGDGDYFRHSESHLLYRYSESWGHVIPAEVYGSGISLRTQLVGDDASPDGWSVIETGTGDSVTSDGTRITINSGSSNSGNTGIYNNDEEIVNGKSFYLSGWFGLSSAPIGNAALVNSITINTETDRLSMVLYEAPTENWPTFHSSSNNPLGGRIEPHGGAHDFVNDGEGYVEIMFWTTNIDDLVTRAELRVNGRLHAFAGSQPASEWFDDAAPQGSTNISFGDFTSLARGVMTLRDVKFGIMGQ